MMLYYALKIAVLLYAHELVSYSTLSACLWLQPIILGIFSRVPLCPLNALVLLIFSKTF